MYSIRRLVLGIPLLLVIILGLNNKRGWHIICKYIIKTNITEQSLRVARIFTYEEIIFEIQTSLINHHITKICIDKDSKFYYDISDF